MKKYNPYKTYYVPEKIHERLVAIGKKDRRSASNALCYIVETYKEKK